MSRKTVRAATKRMIRLQLADRWKLMDELSRLPLKMRWRFAWGILFKQYKQDDSPYATSTATYNAEAKEVTINDKE